MIKAKFICKCSLCGEKRDYCFFDGKHWSRGIDLKDWARDHLNEWHPIEAKRLEEEDLEDEYDRQHPSYYFMYRMVTAEEEEIDSSIKYQYYEDGTCEAESVSPPYIVERVRTPHKPNEYTEAFRSMLYEMPKPPHS